MSKFAAKVALITALAIPAAALPALSQTAPGGGTTVTPTQTTPDVDDDYENEGRNGYWGLLGLLGLFGLMGRKSRRDEVGTTAYRDPDAVGTPGSTRDRY